MDMMTSEAINFILKNDKNANAYRLAKALGCSHSTIANYKYGRTKISFENYNKLKEIYPSIKITDVQEEKEYKLGELKEKI